MSNHGDFIMKNLLFILSILLIHFAYLPAKNIIGPRLKFVISAYKYGVNERYNLPPAAKIPVTIMFESSVKFEETSFLEEAGIKQVEYAGTLLGSKRVLLGFVNLNSMSFSQLRKSSITEIETVWRPHHAYPLLISRPQIEAEQVWQLANPTVTGKNILIADLDTGINHFHPMFFFADGDTLAWIDVNKNGLYDAGIDGIDLDSSGIISVNEILRHIEANFNSPFINNPPGYNPSIDWIYIDSNQNLQRDYGTSAGFTENDPGYGELMFITQDLNGNDQLDAGEQLVMLKTSKVRKVYQTNGVVRERGVDMIQNEGDYYGHGTQVCGILAGGVAGVHQFAGIAPDAEILMGVNVYIPDPPFIQTMEFLAPWAANEGADIILYEDGEWIWQYMDGSSALETMMDDFSNQGIMQVVPTGNLAGGGMHTSGLVPALDSTVIRLSVDFPSGQTKIWGTFLCLGDSGALNYRLLLTSGKWFSLPDDGSFISAGLYQVYGNRSRSSRGTNRMDFIISVSSGSIEGRFHFRLINSSSNSINYHAYETDNVSGWSGSTRWVKDNDDGTVTWPSTADKAFSVAAYNPRSPQQTLNNFSGIGARIDGIRLVDITAPGSTVYSTSSSASNYGGFTYFGGTSSAGSHVAGACALLFQSLGQNDVQLVKDAIGSGANTTNIGSSLPDDVWGYGRIRAFQAVNILINPIQVSSNQIPKKVELHTFPNPFNATTRIQFTPDKTGSWDIIIYNVLGEKIDEYNFQINSIQPVTFYWNAQIYSTGSYFVLLKNRDNVLALKKLTLVK